MACGVPVIGSAVGGLLDTVVDGVTGLHVPPRDPKAIASAAQTLLSNPALRQRLGKAGAERAAERYGHDQVAQATVTVYRRLIRPAQPQVAWASP
jgi:glycosyltransferase involved in cell wall biosynthesis